MVGLVAHGPDVETCVLGKMASSNGADMRRDTIFRIASMTKAILLTQHEFSSASGDPIHQEFQGDAYRALR